MPIDTTAPLILASQSPRRKELLRAITPDFDIVPSHAEEIIDPTRNAEENASHLAELKAQFVAAHYPDRWVLGADTLVVLGEEIIGKPNDAAHAMEILRSLSGQAHRVITGVAIVHNEQVFSSATVSHVHIKPLSADAIEKYVATGEPLDKAGAYAIQGEGAALVQRHEGSYDNIVGLPLDSVRRLLELAKFPAP
ncbi:MAG: septum formation protein Maf [Candidatus Nitrohelix vancouverensis]|uniref:dTTP/UTP pyrophosphatase n=1 Tax=Candidatus Nitrohelix vancouverensis TaxID=2705534 RepID=A0A7T0BZV5_9BACT|nr:MAG: septum formation protein Maf [Candidatus Nitrohelix vancouverensis]